MNTGTHSVFRINNPPTTTSVPLKPSTLQFQNTFLALFPSTISCHWHTTSQFTDTPQFPTSVSVSLNPPCLSHNESIFRWYSLPQLPYQNHTLLQDLTQTPLLHDFLWFPAKHHLSLHWAPITEWHIHVILRCGQQAPCRDVGQPFSGEASWTLEMALNPLPGPTQVPPLSMASRRGPVSHTGLL